MAESLRAHAPSGLVYNKLGRSRHARGRKGIGAVYRKGACVRLFTTVQIMAAAIVNGCACRDANATLRLGDLHKQPLRDIISNRNQAYMKLLDKQQRGEFRNIPESCDFCASIYRNSSIYRKNRVTLQSLEEFKATFG